jgi:hypothetical protein
MARRRAGGADRRDGGSGSSSRGDGADRRDGDGGSSSRGGGRGFSYVPPANLARYPVGAAIRSAPDRHIAAVMLRAGRPLLFMYRSESATGAPRAETGVIHRAPRSSACRGLASNRLGPRDDRRRTGVRRLQVADARRSAERTTPTTWRASSATGTWWWLPTMRDSGLPGRSRHSPRCRARGFHHRRGPGRPRHRRPSPPSVGCPRPLPRRPGGARHRPAGGHPRAGAPVDRHRADGAGIGSRRGTGHRRPTRNLRRSQRCPRSLICSSASRCPIRCSIPPASCRAAWRRA